MIFCILKLTFYKHLTDGKAGHPFLQMPIKRRDRFYSYFIIKRLCYLPTKIRLHVLYGKLYVETTMIKSKRMTLP